MSVTCSNGHENLDGMSFCEECGVELTSLSDTANTAPQPTVPPDAWTPPQPTPVPQVAPDPVADVTAPASPAPSQVPTISEIQVLVPEVPSAGPVAPAADAGTPGTLPPGAIVAGTAYLEITQGPFVGRRFTVTEPVCLIGRWDMDAGSFPQIDLTDVDIDAKVSRKHARITKDPAGYRLEDLGSLNGTSHAGSTRLVPGDVRQLSDGDTVIIGRLFLRFATS